MAANLLNLSTFFHNADAYSEFLHRVTAAIVEKAVSLRAETPPSPVTADWAARQQWALTALNGQAGAHRTALQMLPGLAIRANDVGFLSETGEITVTDVQIRTAIDDAFVNLFTTYVPEVGT